MNEESCDHSEWCYPEPEPHPWTGELVVQEPFQKNTYEDLDLGRYHCVRCKKIGYYTGLWRRHHEGGRVLLDERTGHVRRRATNE